MIKSSQEIIDAAVKLSVTTRRRVAVAVAQDADVIGAVRSACDDGICNGSLFGDEAKIRELADKNEIILDGLEVINETDPNKAVTGAVELAASGGADVVMKGFVSTSGLLKGILDKRFNLRMSPNLSHVAVLDIPGYHKLLMLSDGGMIVCPDFEQRLDIVKNAVLVGRALGIDPVKVALSAANDNELDSMPQTKDSARIVEKLHQDNFPHARLAGPMTFDVAMSQECANKAGIDHPVAGDADAYIFGTIEECNITAKSMIVFADAIFAGVIVGAKIPVSLVSRTDPVKGKKTSLALACLVADYYKQMGEGFQND